MMHSYKKYKIFAIIISISMVIFIISGSILLAVGLLAKFHDGFNPSFQGVVHVVNWSHDKHYSIYDLPPYFNQLSQKAQNFAIIGIVGSAFMYLALILIAALVVNFAILEDYKKQEVIKWIQKSFIKLIASFKKNKSKY